MEKSTIDTLKLRDMMTVPEPPSPMAAAMKQTMDGETCSNYEQAGEDEMAEGRQYSDIAPLLEEMSRLQCYQLGAMHGAQALVWQIWHKESEHPDNKHPYPVLNPDGEMAFAYYDQLCGWQFDRDFKHSANMLWLDIEKILPKEDEHTAQARQTPCETR